MEVGLVGDIRFCQQHHVVVYELHGLDSLGEDKYPAVLDIERSKLEPWVVGWPAPRWRQHCMEVVADMAERVSEEDRHYGPSSSSKSWDSTPQ